MQNESPPVWKIQNQLASTKTLIPTMMRRTTMNNLSISSMRMMLLKNRRIMNMTKSLMLTKSTRISSFLQWNKNSEQLVMTNQRLLNSKIQSTELSKLKSYKTLRSQSMQDRSRIHHSEVAASHSRTAPSRAMPSSTHPKRESRRLIPTGYGSMKRSLSATSTSRYQVTTWRRSSRSWRGSKVLGWWRLKNLRRRPASCTLRPASSSIRATD